MIDIIIPIYNAFDDLQLCLESVFQWTDLNSARIILINDASPDPRIAPYVDSMAGENVLVHHNPKNMGFSANVNYGFRCSEDNDVILLNTDTIVTDRWLKKLNACAYRDASIGTVTPLSNSATICSVPEFCKDNPLPKGYTVESFGRLIEKNSLHRYPEISVAVGFCMYIKREVIQRVGLFDAATFTRGYGEENDFCNRAKMLGYHHVLCDDTFVFHSGTASFIPEEKKVLMEDHERILNERYPELAEQNRVFYTTNPLQDIQMNIKMQMVLDNGKKNILYLVQRDFRDDADDHIGGTQLHVKDLKDGLKKAYNIFVLARDQAFMRLTIYSEEKRISMKFRIGDTPAVPVFLDPAQRDLYRTILSTFAIDLVHVHHTYQLTLDLFYAAHEMKIPLVCTLHDFYYICPTIKLIDAAGNCCALQCDPARCKACSGKNREIPFAIPETVDYIANWRKRNKDALALCDVLITPSENAKQIFSAYFPMLGDKIRVIPHGIDREVPETAGPLPEQQVQKLKSVIEKVPSPDDSTFAGWCAIPDEDAAQSEIFVQITTKTDVLVFPVVKRERPDVAEAFGAQYLMSGFSFTVPQHLMMQRFTIQCVRVQEKVLYTGKDVTSFEQVVRIRQADFSVAFVGGLSAAKGSKTALGLIEHGPKDINWFVIGGTDERKLKFRNQKNYLYTHWYVREELPQLLQAMKIDLICILPIWPETFCYVLSEAIANGVPVLVTDIGALGERTRTLGCGWVVPPTADEEELLKKIQWIRSHPQEYCQVKEKLIGLPKRSVADMAGDYEALYQSLFREAIYGKRDIERMLQAQKLAENGRTADIETMQQLMAAEQELTDIKSGAVYKLLKAVNTWNFPFKHTIKAVVFCILKWMGLQI